MILDEIDTTILNKGVMKIKKGSKVYSHNPDKDKGKRRVKVDERTWVLTNAKTDEEAIERYNRRYKG